MAIDGASKAKPRADLLSNSPRERRELAEETWEGVCTATERYLRERASVPDSDHAPTTDRFATILQGLRSQGLEDLAIEFMAVAHLLRGNQSSVPSKDDLNLALEMAGDYLSELRAAIRKS